MNTLNLTRQTIFVNSSVNQDLQLKSMPFVYALSPEGLFGRWELLIRLDEHAKVSEVSVARSAT